MAASPGEQRIVSVLLVDIADSTAIGEKLGPERSKFLFDEVVRLLASEVKRFGGTVAQFTGDGLYALFGAPSAHEDDAERAVRAALGMHAVLVGYAQDVADAYGVEVAARIGVNTGPVVLLGKDAPAEERYNALGDTVNIAARLQTHAGHSGVVVGPATARQVEAAFELESVGPLELKGKEPVAAFRVVGERALVLRRLTPLVGRDHEVAVLDEVFSELSEGRGAIVAITGEPGIGKSRLAGEVRSRWEDRVRSVAAQGISYAQDLPYYPVRELLRGFLGLGVGDPEARVRLELKTTLAATLGEDADTRYPFLASLLGLFLEDDAQDRLHGLARDSVQRQTHEAVVELTRALSHEQPLALVLEDLHFADDRTLELVEELLSLADEEAVAILLLYRSDPDLRSWGVGESARRRYRHRFRELQLDPLEPEESVRLAASATGGDLPAELAAQLAERAGGNPLFLEEAARDAVERGDDRAAVPAAIHEALQARLDRLAPDVREVASIASVVGRSFGMPLLERLVPPQRLRPALSQLQRLDLVVEERRRPTPEYRFRHGLVQEAAYSSLLQERRRDLHRIVGTALEELEGEELSEAYGLLAHHFAEADEPQRAARYLVEAGNAARAVYADEEATSHYRRAVSFLDRLGDTGAARSVLFKLALAHHLAYDFEAADAAWAEAFKRPEPPPVRLEPTERLERPLLRDQGWVPGHDYDIVAWSFGPNCFRGLFRLEPGLDVVPDVAERISVSADGCAYVVQLREGLRWSDGERLTADDFAFSYRAMQEQAVASAHLLAGIEAHARDEQTLVLRLADPTAHLPYLLAQLGLFPWPRHCVEALGQHWYKETFVGNGPFVVDAVDHERADLVANPLWQGPRGNVGTITVRFLDPHAAVDEWSAGGLDYLFVPRLFGLADAADTEVTRAPLLSVEYLGFSRRSPFDDERVRRALAHGLDRAPLVAGSGDLPAYGGLLPPAMPGHSHDLAPVHDLVLARRLLAEAGYPEGRGLPELRLVHPDPGLGDSLRREIAARWDRQWRELGVRVRQDWAPFEQVDAEVSRDASFWEWGWISDYPDPHGVIGGLLEQRLTPAAHDEDLRSLVDRAAPLRSRDERLQLYRDADRKLVAEQVWMVPISYSNWHLLHRPWVSGLWTHPFGMGPLDDVVVRKGPSPGAATGQTR
jgi:ABC-type transport system substrate-binding protein/class 3 adenylate cyclase